MRKLFAFQSATILDNLLSLVCIQIDLFNFEGKETHQLLFEMVETLECWSFHIEKAICIRLPIATSIFEWLSMHHINYLLVLKMSLHFWLSWIRAFLSTLHISFMNLSYYLFWKWISNESYLSLGRIQLRHGYNWILTSSRNFFRWWKLWKRNNKAKGIFSFRILFRYN